MMKRRRFFCCTALGAAAGFTQSCRKRQSPLPGLPQVALTPRRTAAPVTYVIDYATTHLGNPEYIRKLAEAPPEFLHVGHDVPFLSAAGPCSLANDRDLFGSLPLLDPAAAAERAQAITKLVADVHAARVARVFPYICNQTIGGDPDKRLGFWAFYDRWDRYKDFGIPPKPAADPVKWMQRDPSGNAVQISRSVSLDGLSPKHLLWISRAFSESGSRFPWPAAVQLKPATAPTAR